MNTLAIIVNYRAAALTVEAVRSVLEAQSLGPVRVTVVDNTRDPEESARLRQAIPDSVELLRPSVNLGFGNACNLAAAGNSSDWILLVNPDARLLPGCLTRLQRTLINHPEAGAVSPQLFWDDDLNFHMPPPYPVALFLLDLWRLRGSLGRLATPLIDRLWRRYSVKVWRAGKPLKVNNLSGAVVLIRRAHLPVPSEIFDPRFFLYFEDSDLFLRMRRQRRNLFLDPAAHALHYYDQCGRADWLEKRTQLLRARDLFLAKHYPFLARRQRRQRSSASAGAPMPLPIRTMQPYRSPFTIAVPEAIQDGWLFEWSPHPDFIPAVGRFGTGGSVHFSSEHWRQLAPGRYYGRIGAPTGRVAWIGPFSWQVPVQPESPQDRRAPARPFSAAARHQTPGGAA